LPLCPKFFVFFSRDSSFLSSMGSLVARSFFLEDSYFFFPLSHGAQHTRPLDFSAGLGPSFSPPSFPVDLLFVLFFLIRRPPRPRGYRVDSRRWRRLRRTFPFRGLPSPSFLHFFFSFGICVFFLLPIGEGAPMSDLVRPLFVDDLLGRNFSLSISGPAWVRFFAIVTDPLV